MSTAITPQTGPTSATNPISPVPTMSEPNWKTVYPPEAWRQIRGEGIYLASVLMFGVVITMIILKFPGKLLPHPIIQNVLCCALGGITGSWIYSVKWYVRAVTNKIWRQDLIVWRLTSPFLGIFLSVSVYVVIETGLLGITFARPNAQAGLNLDPRLYAYAIGFMVGLFSDDVMGKLTEVAKTLFGKSVTKSEESK